MPFIELNHQLHPLRNGDNLLGGGPQADLQVAGIGRGQLTVRVERVGTLVWSTGGAQAVLNGSPLSAEPMALRDGDRLEVGGVTMVFRDQAALPAFQVASLDDASIPLGATIPMRVKHQKVAGGGGGGGPLSINASAAGSGEGGGRVIQPARPQGSQASAAEPPTFLQPEPSEKHEVQTVAVLKKTSDGSSYVIAGSGFRIGREKRCDLVVPERSVSRLHAEIAIVGSQYLLRDLGRGGTKVNGKQLSEPHKLRVGDTIEIGSSEFVFARRPADASDLIQPNDITPIISNVEDAPTMVALRRGGSSWFTWVLLLIAIGAAAALVVF